MNTIKKYLSLVTFSHTVFAMPFAFIGFFLAVKYHHFNFSWTTLLLILLCMVFARNAAMSFNRYIDREFDSRNPRTALREVPRGIIKPLSALNFTLINAILFWITTWFINRLVFWLAPIALFVILFYSITKRFTSLCHFILGLGLSLAPIGAYLSITGTFHWLPILFSCIVLFWTSGFDIIYSLQDEDFDRVQTLKSIPVLFGRKGALYLSSTLHAIAATLVIVAGLSGQFHWMYWVGSSIFLSLLLYQHLIVKPDDLSRVNMAFATLNGIASILFALFTITGFYFLN